jgi:hypothetical protein
MPDTDFTSQMVPSADTLRRLAISESGFVFDPVSGNNFTVNNTGLVVLRYLQQTQNFTSLIEELQKRFDAGANDIERDVIEFIGMLREFIGD